MKKTSFLLIGSGRVSQHFSRYLSLLGLEFQVWSRQEGHSALSQKASSSSHILCLIRDSAIEPFLIENENLWQNKIVVQASGALSTRYAEGAHPLMTFAPLQDDSQKDYGLETYKSIPFIIEAGRKPFAEILPGLPNPHWTIPSEQKPLYHALCVLAGNFTIILWQKAFHEFATKFDIPTDALLPYLRQITKNLELRPNESLTGPLARADQKTIEANLHALGNDPFAKVYRAFVDAYAQQSKFHKIGGSA